MKSEAFFKNSIVVVLAAVLCCALWGSATPFIKVGYELIRPINNIPSTILFAGVRFFGAGALTILIYSIARKKLLYPKKENIKRVCTVSLFQTVIQYFFFYVGLSNTTGVKGTIGSGSNAFFCILIASLIFKQEKLTVKKIIACIVGFAGVILININGLDFNMNLTGDGFVLISACSYAVSSVLIKKYSKFEDTVVISGYQFLIGGAVMIIAGLLMGGVICVTSVRAVLVFVYLAFLSAIAYAVWGILLKYNPVSKVTVFSFLIPVFGVLLSKLMLNESNNVSTVNLVITLCLICGGILLLNYNPKDIKKK